MCMIGELVELTLCAFNAVLDQANDRIKDFDAVFASMSPPSMRGAVARRLRAVERLLKWIPQLNIAIFSIPSKGQQMTGGDVKTCKK